MRLITRSAAKRLAVLFFVLGSVIVVLHSTMIRMPSRSFRGPLPELTPEEQVVRDHLRHHVETLAGEIGERTLFTPRKLRATVDHIEHAFAQLGYQVARQSYAIDGEPCHNLEVEIRGTTEPAEVVIVGAHYDSVIGTPGANDNASGVAGMLELARLWQGRQSAKTLRFVAFVNEEPPYFQTEQMGSFVYARHCRERGDNIVAMLSLETIGYYSNERGSQKYPFPLGVFYPSTGDFIGFVSNNENAALVRRCIKAFRENVPFPSEGGALSDRLPGIGWSDHWAFWQAGFPAVMITDTAPFRYPHYHSPEDTPDKLDYERTARVVAGLKHVLEELLER